MTDTTKPVKPVALADQLIREADAMFKAVQGEQVGGTPHAANWSDKPHRLIYDAVNLMRKAATALDAIKEKQP